MQHLTPVGLSKDGRNLVLVSDAGEEFTVPVDQRLRVALRGDNARLGQLEMKMESTLRPRDIQARIRAGDSAEDVAEAAQTTVDAIMPFAAPVLAERAHVAQTALKASIRRRTNESAPGARTLDAASREYLSNIGVRAEDLAWDAWRRDDGRWTLVATYAIRGTEHRAQLTYDQPGRYVVAENDDARLLTGETGAPAEDAAPGRRLSAVPSDPDELPLGDDAIELVRDRDRDVAPEAAADHEPTEAFDDLAADHADADWIADVPAEDAERNHTDDEPYVDETPATEDAAEDDSGTEQERPKKKGRSQVPSWDEIMFGGGKND